MSEQNNDKLNQQSSDLGEMLDKQIEEELKRKNHDFSKHSHQYLSSDSMYDNSGHGHRHHHHHSDSSGEHHHHHHHSDSSGEHHHHHHSDSSGEHHHSDGKSSHHHSHKKKSTGKKVLKIILIIIAILLAFVIALGSTFLILQQLGKSDLVNSTVEQVTDSRSIINYNGHKYTYNTDVVAIAFIGVDKRDINEESTIGMAGQADADIVLTMNVKTGYAKAIAIPRDTMVDVNLYDTKGEFKKIEKKQLCLSFAYGDGKALSCENTVRSMSRVLKNVPIVKYFALDLDGIAALNDAIGGVTLNSLFNYDLKNAGSVKTGQKITLKGKDAETYIRYRDVKDINGSVNRTNRQIQYIKNYVSQILPAVRKDFGVASSLFNTATQYGVTDLSLSNITYLGSQFLFSGLNGLETETIQGTMKQGEDAGVSSDNQGFYAEFHPDEAKLTETVLSTFYNRIS